MLNVVDTSFVHDGKRYTVTADIVELGGPGRCSIAPTHGAQKLRVTTSGGLTVFPIEGGGLHAAAFAAVNLAWRAKQRSSEHGTK